MTSLVRHLLTNVKCKIDHQTKLTELKNERHENFWKPCLNSIDSTIFVSACGWVLLPFPQRSFSLHSLLLAFTCHHATDPFLVPEWIAEWIIGDTEIEPQKDTEYEQVNAERAEVFF